jgi:hypothetical protein
MRIPNADHEAHDWVIGRIAPDFQLLDAWALPVRGGPDDFDSFLETFAGIDPDCTETTLAARLPEKLRGSATTPVPNDTMQEAAGGFVPLYRTADEWAAEISNATVHGVLHLAWVELGAGHHRAQMGVYVKPRGRPGTAYMALISPFRHLVVYPALLRHVERTWESR